jgi:hypothetical protein
LAYLHGGGNDEAAMVLAAKYTTNKLFNQQRGIGILGRWDEKADPHTQYPVGLQLLDGL